MLHKFIIKILLFLFAIVHICACSKHVYVATCKKEKIPIIYSDAYNIRMLGMEKLHAFDTEKYKKIYKYLTNNLKISPNCFYKPAIVSDVELLLVHSQDYLNSLHSAKTIAKVAEVNLLNTLPVSFLQKTLLDPMLYATGGTIQGIPLAVKYKWAINLSGGYHHAKANQGGGFCFFADVPLAIKKFWKKHPKTTFLIIDLDAHQGNGFESIFKNDKRIIIADVYNNARYPGDMDVKKYIDIHEPVSPGTGDVEYLAVVKKVIQRGLAYKPDIIIYNAGSDILAGDRIGGLNVSAAGVIKRDELIFKAAFENKIPVLMVLSGGYTKQSAHIISKSIENILRNIVTIIK